MPRGKVGEQEGELCLETSNPALSSDSDSLASMALGSLSQLFVLSHQQAGRLLLARACVHDSYRRLQIMSSATLSHLSLNSPVTVPGPWGTFQPH